MRGVDAEQLGCIETTLKNEYPSGYFQMDASRIDAELVGRVNFFGIKFCQAACIVENGVRPEAASDDPMDQMDASHFWCDNPYCINPKHLRWETKRVNISRKLCIGWTLWVRGDICIRNKCVDCKHENRCGRFVTITV